MKLVKMKFQLFLPHKMEMFKQPVNALQQTKSTFLESHSHGEMARQMVLEEKGKEK